MVGVFFCVRTPEPSASNRKKDQNSSFTEMAALDELNLDDEEFLDSTTCSVVDLDTAKQELEEFIPHVRNISDSSIRKMAGRDLVRFKQFKKQGELSKYCCSEEGLCSCANILTENSLVLYCVCHMHGLWFASFQWTYFLFVCFVASTSSLRNYSLK